MTQQTKLLIAITTAICLIMFAAGLKPKGFRLNNTASWIEQTDGINFGKLGIAYTFNNQSPAPESFSIELAIKPPVQRRNHLDVIFDLWDTRNQRHTALCQWDSSLMVMKSPSRYFKNSRLHIGKSITPEKACFVTITSSRNHGTDLFINGIHERSTSRFEIFDSNASLGRIVLGNSASASNPWNGELYSLSLHHTLFSKKEVIERYRQWQTTAAMQNIEATIACYAFDEHAGTKVRDRSGKYGDITVPALFSIPQKQILSMPWEDFRFDKSTAIDIAMNLFGFIPFGFFLAALLWSMGGTARHYRIIICILAGAVISLVFELTQAYIPTRSSQMSDVILNVLGTLAGALSGRDALHARQVNAVRTEPMDISG
jgi:hypothetical protein